MMPEAWQKLDQMRGNSSRGMWISSRVWAVWRASHPASLSPPPAP